MDVQSRLLAEMERAIAIVCWECHGGAFDRSDCPRYSCDECRAMFPTFHALVTSRA